MHIVADIDSLPDIDPRISVLHDFGDGDLVVTVPRWGGFTEVVPKLAMAGVRFVEISGNDEIVLTGVHSDDSEGLPAHTRLLFDSIVISPGGRRRSVYVVRIEHLADALNSFKPNGVELEHVFDF
jgi:hypothetical protein